MKKDIQVTKRNGKKEAIDMEKIHRVIDWAAQGLSGAQIRVAV
jgi:ribonucleoside-diphosphate reductase alpha chain